MEKSNQLLLGVWGGPHCLVSCTLSMKRHLKDSIYRASIEFFLKVCFLASLLYFMQHTPHLSSAEGSSGGPGAKPLCVKTQYRSQCSADLSSCYTPNPGQISHTGLHVNAYHLSLTREL